MADFKARSDYFKLIANQSKLIAHNRPISEGNTKLRSSFFRVNGEAEFNAACVNWVHFPCVVHIGHTIAYRQQVTGLPYEGIANHLMFLQKIITGAGILEPDAIETAYQSAQTAMDQFVSYMIDEVDDKEVCGNDLFIFRMNRATAEQVGPFEGNLYGWHLTFFDEDIARGQKYNAANFFNDI